MKMTNVGNVTRLKLDGLTIEGFAISAVASYIMVPELKAVFDLGHCPIEALPYTVFLSHTHKDHVAGVPLYFSLRDMQGMEGGRVYCPMTSAGKLVTMLRAFDAMEGPVVHDRSEAVYGVEPGNEFPFGKHLVRVLEVTHRVESVGYTFVERKKKLLPEFVGAPTEVIVAARKAGQAIDSVVERPVLTYIGDSTIQTLEEHPEVGQSEVLIIEATHMGEFSPEESTKMGHTHLDQIVALYERSPETFASPAIVIKHFSMRYKPEEILRHLSLLPEGLRNKVHPFINR